MSGNALMDGVTVTIPATLPAPAPLNSANQPSSEPVVFTAEQVAEIRKQEKDKLYPQLENQKEKLSALEAQLAVFNQEREEIQRQNAERLQAEAETQRLRELEELSAKELIERQRVEFTAQVEAVRAEAAERTSRLEQERDFAAALVEKQAAYQALQNYKTQRLAEVGDDIAPILIDLVSGNTEEEIERSISTLIAKSSSMIEATQQLSAPVQRLRGVSPAGAAPTGPLENDSDQQTFTLDDIKNMPMDVYAKMESKLKAAVRPTRRN